MIFNMEKKITFKNGKKAQYFQVNLEVIGTIYYLLVEKN